MFEKKVTTEMADKILAMKVDKKMSLRAIGKELGISHETVRLHLNKRFEYRDRIYYDNVTRYKKPKTRHRISRDYDFLQYIRPVFKWATTNYDISRPHLEMLLYLYPKGLFTKNEFVSYHRIIGMYQSKNLKLLIDKGFIYIWRPRKANDKALYALTNKAKRLCGKMHKVLVGDSELPIDPVNNVLAKEGRPRIDGYYMDAIKKMNKDRQN